MIKYNRTTAAAAFGFAVVAMAFAQTTIGRADALVTPSVACPPGEGGCPEPTIRPTTRPTATPAPTPTATPVPTPRPPTSTDVSQLTALIGRSSATVTSIAIVGNFAEACWSDGNFGGAITATNASGSWQTLSSTKGGYTAGDMATLSSSIPANIASQLVSQASQNQT